MSKETQRSGIARNAHGRNHLDMTEPSTHRSTWRAPRRDGSPDDAGYTLVELIMVVTILGLLTAAVVLVLSGMSTEAADTGCRADRRMLDVAVGAHHAEDRQDAIAPSGTDHDRFERALVEGGFLHEVSSMHDLDAAGVVTPEADSSC